MTAEGAHTDHDLVLVVDFGAQYAQLIARRVREARVYSEIVPHTMPVAEMLARNPKAIVLSGGPSSVYEEGAPTIDSGLFTAGTPVFGMCYGFQLMAQGLGGEVAHTGVREYGRTPVAIEEPGTLLADVPVRHNVWMSHGDSVAQAPEGFTVLASTAGTPVAAFEDVARGLAGVQWHPEVLHTEHGQKVLEHFLHDIAGCRQTWTMLNIVEEQVAAIREQIGEGRAICALSGGVDSAVAAAIVQRAIGERLTCVYVDHGMMRLGETEQVRSDFEAVFDKLDVVEASEQFVGALEGIVDPEEKRKIIGREFIRTFEAAEVRVFGDTAEVGEHGVPRPGHALPRRRRVRRRRRHLQHQVPPQRRRTPRRPPVRAGRAAAHPLQGRGPPGRRAARPAVHDGVAPAVPRAWPRHPDHRRGHPRAPRHPAPGRRHRPRGAHPRRPRPRHLADARGPARRRPLGRRPGRRPHLRPPGRDPARSPPRTP